MSRKFANWLAIVGMALNALWPLLANAGPADFSAPICSMVGTKSAPAVAGGLPFSPIPGKSAAPHCPFCTLGSSDYPVLATTAGLVVAPAVTAARLPVAVEFLSPAACRLAAHPRGPPSFQI